MMGRMPMRPPKPPRMDASAMYMVRGMRGWDGAEQATVNNSRRFAG